MQYQYSPVMRKSFFFIKFVSWRDVSFPVLPDTLIVFTISFVILNNRNKYSKINQKSEGGGGGGWGGCSGASIILKRFPFYPRFFTMVLSFSLHRCGELFRIFYPKRDTSLVSSKKLYGWKTDVSQHEDDHQSIHDVKKWWSY